MKYIYIFVLFKEYILQTPVIKIYVGGGGRNENVLA
jgi:hypothetical protein